MKPIEQKLLLAIAADLAYWRHKDRDKELQEMPMGNSQTPQRRERGRCMAAWQAAKDNIVRIDLFEWLGPLSDSQRVMAGRAMARLERDGLIVRHALEGFHERLTHAELTPAGIAKVSSLAVQPQQEVSDAS